jgi:8-oxo-dGTP pyrophosphatase MutT (NUDIX family)
MAAPRPASTVVLLRPSAAGFEVFLVRRHHDIAFMGGAHVFPGGRVDDADIAADEETRHRRAAVRELREETGVTLPAEVLIPFARWVTPALELKRYDTWFFVAELPQRQQPVHDGTENTDSLWIEPAAALTAHASRAIALPPPTWFTLEALTAFDDVEAVLRWARAATIRPLQPDVEERDGVRSLIFPGRRFVLENGRWMPSGGGQGDR